MKILNKIKNIFKLKCPYCSGIMEVEMIDMQIDKLVYKCKKCEKEWI